MYLVSLSRLKFCFYPKIIMLKISNICLIEKKSIYGFKKINKSILENILYSFFLTVKTSENGISIYSWNWFGTILVFRSFIFLFFEISWSFFFKLEDWIHFLRCSHWFKEAPLHSAYIIISFRESFRVNMLMFHT